MARKFLIVLLSIGAIGGFAAGFRRLHHGHHGAGPGAWAHHPYEERVADLCVRAAERTLREHGTPGKSPPGPVE